MSDTLSIIQKFPDGSEIRTVADPAGGGTQELSVVSVLHTFDLTIIIGMGYLTAERANREELQRLHDLYVKQWMESK